MTRHRDARTEGFFDAYPRFFETSETMPYPNRLNHRYTALVGRNARILQGASVLDLASHDGRWSFAALKTGARKVVGLEGQRELVDDAGKTLAHYGIPRTRYRFVCGDLFETIKPLKAGSFDVVFCFGIFHMHNRHYEMLHQIERLSPAYLVMDAWILPFTNDPVTYLVPQSVDADGVARQVPGFAYPPALSETADKPVSVRDGRAIKFRTSPAAGDAGGVMMIAYPSRPALEWLLAEAGFGDLDYYDWPNAPLESWNHVADYVTGQRVSLTARNLRRRR